ncbi:hypothetical protein Back11_34270 [Paenibacillus baekrokdamisoli]|uniref:Uncharacterized protein n=2 Tax=Paenibacillus baekrokdamisoli TaxID=1712516 RepID=A0A3G9IV30_9BACL|nr:hypothetical protein [Paenibacillus baekrokdamisoli]BBH22082.1 hypothetical protein Back11_34270 [Paenibacillus baekrokdamisoli]
MVQAVFHANKEANYPDEHRQLARTTATESMGVVLLKNENGILPLSNQSPRRNSIHQGFSFLAD